MKKRTFFQHVCPLLLLIALLCPTVAACKKDTEEETCAHENAEWAVLQEANGTEEGLKHKFCPDCNTSVAVAIIPAPIDGAIETLKTTLAASIVKVIGYAEDGTTTVSQGTGFFVSTNGIFITNAHVVKDCHFVQITDHAGQTYNANAILAYKMTTSDYAVLRVAEEITTTPLSFTEISTLNSNVYALGFPNDAAELCVSAGVLSSSISDKYFLSSAEVENGNSGGPLTNTNGRVIGLVTSVAQNGNCIVLKYSDFKTPLTNALAEGATPVKELPIRPTV